MGGYGRPWFPTPVHRPQEDDPPTPTDQIARSYANLRFECADLEAIIGAGGISDKDLKRLDKAVTVMKVTFKIIARVLRSHGYETGRKRLEQELARANTPEQQGDADHG